jgi:hypothetical protein
MNDHEGTHPDAEPQIEPRTHASAEARIQLLASRAGSPVYGSGMGRVESPPGTCGEGPSRSELLMPAQIKNRHRAHDSHPGEPLVALILPVAADFVG